jgi:drug/metabolite transporter (DMT)-like permease
MLIFGERAGAGRILGLVLLLVGMVLIEHGGADGSAEPVTQRIANEARVE